MKYPCEIIKDLMPIYIENLCSDETRNAVEIHLKECEKCQEQYMIMKENGDIPAVKENNELLMQKSLKNVKKRIKTKHILSVVATVAIMLAFAGISYVAAIGLMHIEYPILYEDNITIDTAIPEGWEDHIGPGNKYFVHCKGRVIEGVIGKAIDVTVNGKTEKYLFFQLRTNKWYDLITGKNEVTHQPFSDVDYYDRIYYYPGYLLEDLAAIAEGEMEHILSVSTLMVQNN